MASAAPRRMTLTEFLEWNDGTDTRYELVLGMPVAMAPALEIHDLLAFRLASAVAVGLRPPCRVMLNRGIVAPSLADTFFLPDIVLTCAPLAAGSRYTPEPRLLAEVLSPSTMGTDTMFKLAQFQDMPSVEDILFVWTTARRIDLWQRDQGRWQARTWIGDAVLPLRSAAPLAMADLYDGIPLEAWDGGTRVQD